MKKTIILTGIALLAFYAPVSAQNGRPAKIDNTPQISVKNSSPSEIATLADKLGALENRIKALEADNAALKEQNNQQSQQLKSLSSAQDANYKVLDYSLNQLKKRIDSQIGTFRITGFICTKAFGTGSCVNALFGQKE